MPPRRANTATKTKSIGSQRRKLCGRLAPLLQSKRGGRESEVKDKKQKGFLKQAEINKAAIKQRAQA
jgi:hypothetical protein